MSLSEHLKGKVALVTGSTSGIGLATAHKLAQTGCHIILHGLVDNNVGNELVDDFTNQYKNKTVFSSADLSSTEAIDSLFQLINDNFQQLDIVVNNAGIQFTSPVESFPLEKWNLILNINLTAAFYVTQKALPLMHKNNWGRIINIASVHGLVGSVNKSAYVAAKHGLIGLTKVTGIEQASHGVTANAICPGWVETPLINEQIEAIAADDGIDISAAKHKLITAKQPLPEMAKAAQIADMVLFLCSESAGSVTGSALTIDGGWTAQ